MRKPGILGSVLLFCVPGALAADWPTYRADAGRTGYTTDELAAKLSLRWTYMSRQAPTPAWPHRSPMPGRPRASRLPFDRAYHTVIAKGTLYFGSSADCKVYALDAATGEQRWAFFTGAPVRFAPVVWKDRLFVASDDGHLYCLATADGKVVWKRRGGPDDRMVLGNGRMVSRWPARGGPVVVDDVVYFGAGIWPTDGIYLYALDATTGRVLWCNDRTGGIKMPQPHSTAVAKSGVSAQGYLVANDSQLFVPTGRAVPAAFGRANGELAYFHLQRYGHRGGTPTVVIDQHLFNGKEAYRTKDGIVIAGGIPALAVAASADRVVYATPEGVAVVERAAVFRQEERTRDEKTFFVPVPDVVWTCTVPDGNATALIVANRTIIRSAPNKVTTIGLDAKAILWSASVDGDPYGLAVADGRLYVSTDRGLIYCFDGERTFSPALLQAETEAAPYGENALYAAAAEEIIKTSGVTEGYCLDLGCGHGQLAYELAKRTKLRICGVDADPVAVASARQKLDAAELYGTRVTVHQADPAKTDYPKYFANLIVSCRSVNEGVAVVRTNEIARIQRPYGGVACLGKPGSMTKRVRGPLKGAGSWTHQYCNPANTCCSSDTLVKGPLGILWYDSPDLRTPNRHGRPPAPLFMDGRLFAAGLDAIRAMDPYNGLVLWESPVKGLGWPYHQEHLMGTAGTNSSYCAANGSVYVGVGPRCIRIDAATGEQLAEFEAPVRPDDEPGRWGYIACEDGILYGTLVNEAHLVPYRFEEADMRKQFTEAVSVFALDAKTGKSKWTHVAKRSIRHNAIAIGGGRVYLIDRALAFEPPRRSKETKPHPLGELISLDAKTGQVLWRSDVHVYGTMLVLSVEHDALLMCYQATRFRLGSEVGGRFAVYRASTGKRLWESLARYRSRPLINGRTIYAEPGAWDLLTGKPKRRTASPADKNASWEFTRSYGCGTIAASRNLLVFRSATMGYIDLLRDNGTQNFGGIRPGCWVNTLPAGGVVVMPDFTNLCSCSYLNKGSVALQPME